MEVDETQTEACVIPGAGNGNMNELDMKTGGVEENISALRGWRNSSRIIRVSKASEGKDRHSKVMTSKGLRDRRVRLSVGTAIQFYDLQDRLGYDQPSKAVQWLINAADEAIAELPSLNALTPETKTGSQKNKTCVNTIEAELRSKNESRSPSKSASTSETSKISETCASPTEVRGRTAKQRQKETAPGVPYKHYNLAPAVSHSLSFTQLLSAGFGNNWNQIPTGNSGADHQRISGQIYRSRNTPQATPIPAYSICGGNHNNLEQLSFCPDNMIPSAVPLGGGGDYRNLNFNSSPCDLVSFNRGTLQSNSPLHYNYLHRLSSPIGMPEVDPHQQHDFPTGLDGH